MVKNLLRRLAALLPEPSATRQARRYATALGRGEAAGSIRYGQGSDSAVRPGITLCTRQPTGTTVSWLETQTLGHLVEATGRPADNGWFLAPGPELPPVPPAWLESVLLIALTENLDAVTLADRLDLLWNEPIDAHHLASEPWRSLTLFHSDGYSWEAETDSIRPTATDLKAKVIGPSGVGSDPPRTVPRTPRRRGPYLAGSALHPVLDIGVSPSLPPLRDPSAANRPGVLVTAPFLARGGAEHTLFETLRLLADRCRLVFATLAPHRAELDDRRPDFERLSPHLFSLGDWVHPDAMLPILRYLIDEFHIDVLYNANGTTLFYDFAPRLKAECPTLRIVDHLYDHRVGYVDRYRDRTLLESIDACIAENHPIAATLVGDHGWPGERVPVVWSCGRSPDDLPAPEKRGDVRRRLRQELGYGDDAVVFLTAARMHDQKRPADIVALAETVADDPSLHFLIVGGGPLETAVDEAIAAAPTARIRRLPFRTDIPGLILAADAGLLVSEFEGLPVFLLECLQLGRPFIGTDVGDLGRVVRNTGAGLVVDRPGDIEGLAAAVRRMAPAEDRVDWERRAKDAGERFVPSECAERYWEVLFPATAGPAP